MRRNRIGRLRSGKTFTGTLSPDVPFAQLLGLPVEISGKVVGVVTNVRSETNLAGEGEAIVTVSRAGYLEVNI